MKQTISEYTENIFIFGFKFGSTVKQCGINRFFYNKFD